MPKKKANQQEEEREFVKKELPEQKVKSIKKESASPPKKTPKAMKTAKAKKADHPSTSNEGKENAKLEEELMKIYENKDGSMPDMTHFEKRRKSRLVTAFFTLLFSVIMLGTIAYVGFFVFEPQSQFSESDVILTVVGEEDIESGGDVQYRIRYRNAQRIPLAQVKVLARFPEGFVFESADPAPTNDQQTEWTIGSLDGGDGGFIDIFGALHGDIGDRQSLRVFLNYTPSNFSSEFQKVVSLTSETATSTIAIAIDGPEELQVGAEGAFTVDLSNLDTEAGTPLALEIETANGFTLVEADPSTSEDNKNQWIIDTEEESQSYTLTGLFEEGEVGALQLRVRQWKDDKRSGEGYIIAEAEQEVALFETDVRANLVINGTLDNFATAPGEILNASVVVKNLGAEVVEDVQLTLVFDAPSSNNRSILDWIELDDEADGSVVGEQRSEEIRRGSITWTSRQDNGLRRLAPGDEVILDISLPIKSAEDTDITEYTAYQINAVVDAQFDRNDERETLRSNQISMVVNSDMNLDVQHDVDDQDHTIRYLLTNSFHELSDIVVEADIFGDITWLDDDLIVPAGEASFDEGEQQLRWTINTMPTSLDILALQFGVRMDRVNPSQTNLTSKVRVTATDTVTGERITLVGDEVLLQ